MFETVRKEAKGRIRTARMQRQVALDELVEKRLEVQRLEDRIEALTKVEEDYSALLDHFGDTYDLG